MDNIHKNPLVKQDIILIVVDMSIKNDIATAISHIYREQEIIVKITHYVTVRIARSRLGLFYFLFSFPFLFDSFYFILLLELGLGLE